MISIILECVPLDTKIEGAWLEKFMWQELAGQENMFRVTKEKKIKSNQPKCNVIKNDGQ